MMFRYTQEGWPAEVSTEMQPYYRRRAELSIEAGCLFWGTRVIVPLKLRPQVLAELHTSHPGIVRMKELARAHVWWPGLSESIEQAVFTVMRVKRIVPDCTTAAMALARHPLEKGAC